MYTYKRTNWVANVTPLSDKNFNNIEEGIAKAYEELGLINTSITTINENITNIENDITNIENDITNIKEADKTRDTNITNINNNLATTDNKLSSIFKPIYISIGDILDDKTIYFDVNYIFSKNFKVKIYFKNKASLTIDAGTTTENLDVYYDGPGSGDLIEFVSLPGNVDYDKRGNKFRVSKFTFPTIDEQEGHLITSIDYTNCTQEDLNNIIILTDHPIFIKNYERNSKGNLVEGPDIVANFYWKNNLTLPNEYYISMLNNITTPINMQENTLSLGEKNGRLILRDNYKALNTPHSWSSSIQPSIKDDECIVFASSQPKLGWIFAQKDLKGNLLKPCESIDWETIQPILEIFNGGVFINGSHKDSYSFMLDEDISELNVKGSIRATESIYATEIHTGDVWLHLDKGISTSLQDKLDNLGRSISAIENVLSVDNTSLDTLQELADALKGDAEILDKVVYKGTAIETPKLSLGKEKGVIKLRHNRVSDTEFYASFIQHSVAPGINEENVLFLSSRDDIGWMFANKDVYGFNTVDTDAFYNWTKLNPVLHILNDKVAINKAVEPTSPYDLDVNGIINATDIRINGGRISGTAQNTTIIRQEPAEENIVTLNKSSKHYTISSPATTSRDTDAVGTNFNNCTQKLNIQIDLVDLAFAHIKDTDVYICYEWGITLCSGTTPFEIQITKIINKTGTATYDFLIPTDKRIYFTGDDCIEGEFIPQPTTYYDICIWWNGCTFEGVVRGIQNRKSAVTQTATAPY